MRDLRGKNALVTGASRGLGPLIAQELARAGVNLAVSSRPASAAQLEKVAHGLSESGVRAISISAEITQSADRQCLVDQAQFGLGSVDILVNNAGLENIARFAAQSEADVRSMIETNLIAPIELARLVLPGMLARHSGHIVNMSSMAGKCYLPYHSIYSAAKAGLNAWALSLRDELQGTGVSISTICPGFVSRVGMASGLAGPRGVKWVPPERVTRAVMDALRRDRFEILVYPSPIKLSLAMAQFDPTLVISSFRRSGIAETLKQRALAKEREKS